MASGQGAGIFRAQEFRAGARTDRLVTQASTHCAPRHPVILEGLPVVYATGDDLTRPAARRKATSG